MKKKEKMLLPFYILLLVAFGMADSLMEPSLLMTKVENYAFYEYDFEITCKTSAPIKECFFQFENSAIDVPDGYIDSDKFSYKGAGFESGECGIDLKAKWDMEGTVSCGVQLAENGHHLTAHGKILVDKPFVGPTFESYSNSVTNNLLQFNEGQPMHFSCRAKAGNYSKAELLFGNETLAIAQGTDWANSTIRNAEFSDNGKLVVCNVTHPASDWLYPTVKRLDILFAPRPSDEVNKAGTYYMPKSSIPFQKLSIRIMVAANPNLSAVYWTVNGKEADGKKFKPLSINQSTFSEPHWWEVGMDVDPLTEDDLLTTFQLHLTNEVGTTKLPVRLHDKGFLSSVLLTVIVAILPFVIVAGYYIAELISSYRKFVRGQRYAVDARPCFLENIKLFFDVSALKSENCPTSKLHKDELKRAQVKEVVNWREHYILADTECLQELCKHSANSDLNDFGEWHLVKHVKSNFFFMEVFEGKLFFNVAKRQLVVLCIQPLSYLGTVQQSLSIYPAVTFGEKVRLLVNKFKVEPLVLATGQGGGGCLAQVLTFSMKNLQVENNEIVRLEEKGVHCHTVTFEAPPSFRAIRRMAKDPLDQDALRLAITNHISDQQLIDCCSSEGPHVGRVVFHKKQQQDELQPLQQKQLLSNVGSSNLNFARFDLKDLNEVKSFAAVKQEESNGAIPWFFFDKSEWERLKWEESKQESERKKQVAPFQFNNASDLQSEVAENEFIARIRLLSRVNFSITYVCEVSLKPQAREKIPTIES